ncbi:MAG TPA: DUF2249 domain-containing protein [Chloroflexota bacterium]|nr:DUF2249 domain-containing protein [Chloroflexota bacterium]
MSNVGEAIRGHHAELLDTLTKQSAFLTEDRPEANPAAFLDFLKEDLLPHARGEERHLYLVMDVLIKAYGRPTETMRIDHQAIEEYVRRIEDATHQLETADETRSAAIKKDLGRLALQLAAVFAVHLRKEEEAYLPLLEAHLTDGEQEQVLEGMHATTNELDVRTIPPPQRHGLIFQTFTDLGPGESFVLVNDHDPKPLYYAFKAQGDGRFTWDYEQQGPRIWRVRIGKVA